MSRQLKPNEWIYYFNLHEKNLTLFNFGWMIIISIKKKLVLNPDKLILPLFWKRSNFEFIHKLF